MTEQLKSDNFSAPQQTEPDVLVLIKKMQQQLASLEKKIDILISQSQEKPFREKHFSKPFRSFDRPYRPGHYHDKKDHGDDPKNSSSPDRHFKKKYGGKKGGFDPRKKSFFHKRKDQ